MNHSDIEIGFRKIRFEFFDQLVDVVRMGGETFIKKVNRGRVVASNIYELAEIVGKTTRS